MNAVKAGQNAENSGNYISKEAINEKKLFHKLYSNFVLSAPVQAKDSCNRALHGRDAAGVGLFQVVRFVQDYFDIIQV